MRRINILSIIVAFSFCLAPAELRADGTCAFNVTVKNRTVSLFTNYNDTTGISKWHTGDNRDSHRGSNEDTCTNCDVVRHGMRLDDSAKIHKNPYNSYATSNCFYLDASVGPYDYQFPRVLWGACQPYASVSGGVKINVGQVNGKYVPNPAYVWSKAQMNLRCGSSCFNVTGSVAGQPKVIVRSNSSASQLSVRLKLYVTPSASAKAFCVGKWSWQNDSYVSGEKILGYLSI